MEAKREGSRERKRERKGNAKKAIKGGRDEKIEKE